MTRAPRIEPRDQARPCAVSPLSPCGRELSAVPAPNSAQEPDAPLPRRFPLPLRERVRVRGTGNSGAAGAFHRARARFTLTPALV